MFRNLLMRSGRSLIRNPLKNLPWRRLNSNCACNDPYDLGGCFRKTECEGIIRTSSFDPVTVPEMRLHDYVWNLMHKWQDHVALVIRFIPGCRLNCVCLLNVYLIV